MKGHGSQFLLVEYTSFQILEGKNTKKGTVQGKREWGQNLKEN